MKRIVALAVATAGAVVVGRRWQARQAEQALWAEITDPAPRPHSTEAAPEAPSGVGDTPTGTRTGTTTSTTVVGAS